MEYSYSCNVDVEQTSMDPFKKCTVCEKEWPERDAFLDDPDIKVLGYQVNLEDMEKGFYLFNHEAPNCGTSLVIHPGEFRDLYHGPTFDEVLVGTETCEGRCLLVENLGRCSARCQGALYREILAVLVARCNHRPGTGRA